MCVLFFTLVKTYWNKDQIVVMFILMDILRFNHSPKALYSRGLTSPVNNISVLFIAVNTLGNSKMSRVLTPGPRQEKLVGKTISENLMQLYLLFT
jgi:hypothetical protein